MNSYTCYPFGRGETAIMYGSHPPSSPRGAASCCAVFSGQRFCFDSNQASAETHGSVYDREISAVQGNLISLLRTIAFHFQLIGLFV